MTTKRSFFLVGGTWSTAALRVDPTYVPEAADPFAEFKGESEPIVRAFRVSHGRSDDDYVVTGLLPITLVSRMFVEALQEEGVVGWSTYQIDLERRRGWPAKDYFGLTITGRCGAIDNSRSPLTPRISPHTGKRHDVYMGLYFDEGSWGGSDLFVPSDKSAHLFATDRVREVAKRKRLKGMVFEPIERVERFML